MKRQPAPYFVWIGICALVWGLAVAHGQPATPPATTSGEAPETAEPEEPTPEKTLREIERREREERERHEMAERMRLIKLQLAFQFRENERWEREALERETELVREGEEFFEDKDFREAKDRYLDAIEITYLQWVFTADTMAFVSANKEWHKLPDFLPRCQKKRFPLSTEFTRLALVRLADLDTIIAEYELAEKRVEADNALDRSGLAVAYRKYGDALEHARKMGQNTMALRYVREMEHKRSEILASVLNPLEVAKASLDADEPAAALAALQEFEKNFQDFLLLAEVKRAYDALAGRPELKQEVSEQAGIRLVALGDASVTRKDYQRAIFWYRRAALRYANTRAGALAEEKRSKLLEDPEVVAMIEQQEAEYVCKAMLARASTFASWGKNTEAAAVYDEIVQKYPDTPWAKEAAEAKALMTAAEPQ